MKKLISILFVVFMLFGCSSKDYAKLLVGTFSWTSSSGEEIIMSFDGDNYYTLNTDVALTMVPYELDGQDLIFDGGPYSVDFNDNNDLLLTLDPEYYPVEMKRMSDTYLYEVFNTLEYRKKLCGYWKFDFNGVEHYLNFDTENNVYIARQDMDWKNGRYYGLEEDDESIFIVMFGEIMGVSISDTYKFEFSDINHMKLGEWNLTRIHESEVNI